MKKKIVGILVVMLLITTLIIVSAKKPKDKPDYDWDYWSNPPHMFSNLTGNYGIGTMNPNSKLEVNGTITGSFYLTDMDFVWTTDELFGIMVATNTSSETVYLRICEEVSRNHHLDEVSQWRPWASFGFQ